MVEIESVPELVDLRIVVFALRRCNWLRETEEWQCQIDESVPVVIKLVLAIDELVKFENYEAGDKRGRRCDGWNNLSGDELYRQLAIDPLSSKIHLDCTLVLCRSATWIP